MKNVWHKLTQTGMAAVVGGLLVGWLIGYLAWGEGRGAQLAVLLPFVVGVAISRPQAFAIALGYSLASSRGCPDYANSWFNDSLIVGYGMYFGAALLGGLGWSLGWSASDKPWRKALASVVAYVVMLVPPMAVLTTGHALLGWGFLYPGWGWAGVAMSVAAPAYFLWVVTKRKLPRKGVMVALALFAVFLGAESAGYKDKEERYVADLVAVPTKWGVTHSFTGVLDRIDRIGATVRRLGEYHDAAAVVFPESILQTYTPDLFPFLKKEVLQPAADAGMTVVLGADLTEPDGSLQNSAIAFYPDGRTLTLAARQPAPFSLWKPWATRDSFPPDWSRRSVFTMAHDVKARLVFCYEEYIPLLALIDEAREQFQVTLVMSNTWAAKTETAAVIQRRHSQAMARLFSRTLLRAENSMVRETVK